MLFLTDGFQKYRLGKQFHREGSVPEAKDVLHGSSDGQVVNNAACQTMTTPKSQNSQEYVSFVFSLLVVQTYIATLYLRQKCTSTGELFSESLQRRIVPNNSSRFVCSRIFRAFELELSTSMLALREVSLLQKLPNYRGYSHANGGSTSPARAT
jgi:hypothetical protein